MKWRNRSCSRCPSPLCARDKSGRKVIQYRLIDNFDIHRPVDALLVYEQFKLVGKRQAHTKLLLACIPFNQLLGSAVRSVLMISGFDLNESVSVWTHLHLLRSIYNMKMFCLNCITDFTCAQIVVMAVALMVKVREKRAILEGHVAVRPQWQGMRVTFEVAYVF